mmetsp:Transcript_72144/g.108900  ORF Transcript_72144/g.108900 Transcript_72144/m.108900 type:complete len:200 (+) Transcript_72144:28-627(+)
MHTTRLGVVHVRLLLVHTLEVVTVGGAVLDALLHGVEHVLGHLLELGLVLGVSSGGGGRAGRGGGASSRGTVESAGGEKAGNEGLGAGGLDGLLAGSLGNEAVKGRRDGRVGLGLDTTLTDGLIGVPLVLLLLARAETHEGDGRRETNDDHQRGEHHSHQGEGADDLARKLVALASELGPSLEIRGAVRNTHHVAGCMR